MLVRHSNILHLLLITIASVCLVEGVYLGLEQFIALSEKAAKTPEITSEISPPKKQGLMSEGHDYTVITQRNLFGPPPSAQQQTQPPPPEDAALLKPSELKAILMGTVMSDGDGNRAIILDKLTRKQQIYEVGDTIQEAIIKDILHGKVVVVYNGKDEILDISEAATMRKKVRPTPMASGGGNQNAIRRPPLPGRAVAVAPVEPEMPTIVGENQPGEPPAVRRLIRPRISRPETTGQQD